MARLYAEQGYYEKAMGVYRRLIAKDPLRPELRDALAELASKRDEENEKDELYEDLSRLFRQWLDLLLQYQKIEKLKNLQLG
jgi:hypothetical protein